MGNFHSLSMYPFAISPIPSAAVIELLERNVIGTPGVGMRYQHLCVREKIFTIEKPYFVQLTSRKTLFGTCCFCSRTTVNAGDRVASFYVRYFSFRDGFRSNGKSVETSRRGMIRSAIARLLDGDGLETRSGDKFFHYAYVDPKNIRSSRLCEEFGFEVVRKIGVTVFSRLFPKSNTQFRIEQLREDEYDEMKSRLTALYVHYTMFSFENLFRHKPYYVLRDGNGEILAGAQVSSDRWRILSMPGIVNNALLHIGSYLPVINRMLNQRFSFLAVDGLYFRDGKHEYTSILLEHLLHLHDQHNAFIASDCDSSLFQHLSNLDLGLVSRLSKSVPTTVICRFQNFATVEKEKFKSRSAYVSTIDIT